MLGSQGEPSAAKAFANPARTNSSSQRSFGAERDGRESRLPLRGVRPAPMARP